MSLLGRWHLWRAARRKERAALRAERFWQWFGGVSEALLAIARNGLSAEPPTSRTEAWVTELNRRAAAYHPAVRAVLGQTPESPELVLTAEGNPAGAGHVRLLAASRPSLPGWTIRTFKPALSDCVVQVGPVRLTPDAVDFAVIDLRHPDVGERTLLLLFVPGLAGPHSEETRIAATALVDAVVGEEKFL